VSSACWSLTHTPALQRATQAPLSNIRPLPAPTELPLNQYRDRQAYPMPYTLLNSYPDYYRRGDPSFPAFLPGARSLREEYSCADHDGFSVCSPSAICLLSRCVLSSSAMLSVWQSGRISVSPPCNAKGSATPTALLARVENSGDDPSQMERDGVFGNHGIGSGENPFLNRAGKDDEHTHHDRFDHCASYCTCSFVAARMRRRTVSCETPYAAATVRSGSFCSTTRCMISGHCSVGIPYLGCFGPGRRLLTIGGGLASWVSSWASNCWTLRYNIPKGAKKRYKIGDSVVETRRFRSVPRSCPRPERRLGQVFPTGCATR